MQFSLLIFLTLFSALAFAAPPATNETLDELMQKWLSLESQRGHLHNQWRERSQMLEHKIAMYDKERQALQQVLDSAQKQGSEVAVKRQEMLETQTRLEQEQAEVEGALQNALVTVHKLLPQLPPPLQDAWHSKVLVLEQDGGSNSERLERILGLFKQVEDFNRRVVLHRGVMLLPGTAADTIMVNQIYLGVSQGWYISDDGQQYGYGRATELGWQWWDHADALAMLGISVSPKALANTLTIIENPTLAEFVQLPLVLGEEQE